MYSVTPHVLIAIIRLIRVISANSHDNPPNQNFSYQLGPDRSDRWSQPVSPVEPMSTVLGPTTFKSLSHSLSLISSLLTMPAPSHSRAPSSPNPHSLISHLNLFQGLGELQIGVKDHPLHVLLPGVMWNLQFFVGEKPIKVIKLWGGLISFSRWF